MKRSKQVILSILFIVLCLPRNAYAYIDAGTASYVASLLIAGFIGILVYMKVIIQNIGSFVKNIGFFFNDIKEFVRFVFIVKKEDKQIVFYAEHEGYYRNFEGLIYELNEKHQQTISYITSDPKDPVLSKENERLKTFYINKLVPLFMAIVNCKVFVITLTDLNQFHLKRSVNSVHYVYVFHSPISTHLKYLKGAFDHYDSLLCVGPYQVKEIRKSEEIQKLPNKQLIEAGYYPLEQIYEKYKNAISSQSDSKKTKVLIAPSWGKKNVIESCGEDLIDILLKNGYEVVVRPHPETVRRDPDLVNQLEHRFGRNEDFLLERSISSVESLLTSDVLICDSSGVAIEYAFGTESPVIFLDVPYMVRNEDYKELELDVFELSIRNDIGKVVSSEKLEEIPGILKEMVSNRHKVSAKIKRLRDENIFRFGHSSEIGAQHIIDVYKKRKDV